MSKNNVSGSRASAGFHASGAEAYEKAINAEYESKRKQLEAQLREAGSEEERLRLTEELRDLKAKYDAATAHCDYRLF